MNKRDFNKLTGGNPRLKAEIARQLTCTDMDRPSPAARRYVQEQLRRDVERGFMPTPAISAAKRSQGKPPRTTSELPPALVAVLNEQRIPLPVPEFRFCLSRKWRFDYAWPNLVFPVYVEVDGGLFIGGRHNRGAALLKDYEKRNTASAMGWRGLWTTPDKLLTYEFLSVLKRALEYKP